MEDLNFSCLETIPRGAGVVYMVQNPKETRDFSWISFDAPVIIDGRRRKVCAVLCPDHAPPYHIGEAVGLFVKG